MHQPDYRSEMYQALAETLAEPPDWLALPGSRWPLTQAAEALALRSPAAAAAVPALCAIPAESLHRRRQRYRGLLGGRVQPDLSPYESMQRHGRLLSPTTHTVERIYRAAGLTPSGPELPDHAALELAFLAYLAERQAAEPAHGRRWEQLERAFLRRHAGQWLPALGRALAGSGDPVYGPVGHLLTAWLGEALAPRRPRPRAPLARQPALTAAADCHLCGFCAQVCPTHALTIHESAELTTLTLNPAACTACAHCERVCQAGVLKLSDANPATPDGPRLVLRQSPRVLCPDCGQPTVSQAEMAFVVAQLGPTPWLARCLACRAGPMETHP